MARTIDSMRVLGSEGDYSLIVKFENSTQSKTFTIWNWRDNDDAPNGEEPYITPCDCVEQILSDLVPSEDFERVWLAIDKGEAIDETFFNWHGISSSELYGN
jgi:hypothetical protein